MLTSVLSIVESKPDRILYDLLVAAYTCLYFSKTDYLTLPQPSWFSCYITCTVAKSFHYYEH